MAMLMPTMAAVHEQVHERAGEQDEIGQHTQEVRGMLGNEEEAGDEQEADQNDLAALAHAMVMFAHMIVMDSETETAMCLGRTYLVGEKGAEALNGADLSLFQK